MGMWGIGVFASDSASDFLDGVVDDFAGRISAALGIELCDDEAFEVKSLKAVELADLDRIALPSVAILIRLCEAPAGAASRSVERQFAGDLLERVDAHDAGIQLPAADDPRMPDPVADWKAVPPEAHVIRAWRERALAAFVANIETSGVSTDYRKQRPEVIRRAFDRLEALALAAGI